MIGMSFRKNFFVRKVVHALRWFGASALPAGTSKPYQFTYATQYWHNVPRGFGGTFDTRTLQNISDGKLLQKFEEELVLAKSTSPERKTGFAKALQTIGSYASPRVMDYGSGIGLYGFEILAQHPNAHVAFVDINQSNLKIIERIAKIKNWNQRISFCLVADEKSRDLHFDKPFDLALSMGVLHHTPYAQDIVQKISTFLKMEGIFQAMLYNENFLRQAERAKGKKLNTSTFGKITDPDCDGLSNPYSEAYDLNKTKHLFKNYEFVSLDYATPFYSIYQFRKTSG